MYPKLAMLSDTAGYSKLSQTIEKDMCGAEKLGFLGKGNSCSAQGWQVQAVPPGL